MNFATLKVYGSNNLHKLSIRNDGGELLAIHAFYADVESIVLDIIASSRNPLGSHHSIAGSSGRSDFVSLLEVIVTVMGLPPLYANVFFGLGLLPVSVVQKFSNSRLIRCHADHDLGITELRR